MRPPRLVAALSSAALLLAGLTACTQTPIVELPSVAQTAVNAPLRVGTASVPDGGVPLEAALLAHVYAAALNAAGVNAVVVPEDPAQPATIARLADGGVDIVPGYSSLFLEQLAAPAAEDIPAPPESLTGTAAAPTVSAAASSGEVLSTLEQALPAGVSLTEPSSAENNDGLAVTTVTAEKYQLTSISDLAKVCDQLSFGGSADFRTKDTGLALLESAYTCVPQSYRELPNTQDELLLALLRAEIQVADLHSSSPALSDNALVVLDDDRNIFLPHTVVPLVADATVTKEIAGVLDKVSAVLDDEELIDLNRLSQDSHYGSLDAVAQAWLVQRGLLKATS